MDLKWQEMNRVTKEAGTSSPELALSTFHRKKYFAWHILCSFLTKRPDHCQQLDEQSCFIGFQSFHLPWVFLQPVRVVANKYFKHSKFFIFRYFQSFHLPWVFLQPVRVVASKYFCADRKSSGLHPFRLQVCLPVCRVKITWNTRYSQQVNFKNLWACTCEPKSSMARY